MCKTHHLGNVLAVISDKKIGHEGVGEVDYYEADILSSNEYYPFGMQIPGRSYEASSLKYRYGFNGKENDNDVKGEGNQQDYGMRIYDPRLGIFLSVDPLFQGYPWYTPYQFAGNSPILSVDIDGLEPSKVLNWVEKFAKGFAKGFIGHEDGKPIGSQPYTLDTHAGKTVVDGGASALKEKLQEYKKDPLQFGRDVVNGVKQRVKNTYENATNGDPEKMGKVAGATANLAAETILFTRAFSTPFRVTTLRKQTFETLYRVQGGGSKMRFIIESNKLSIAGEDLLFVNIGQEGRALEFLAKRGDDAVLVKFDIKMSFVDKIRKEAVPQNVGRQNPGKPQIVDPTKASDQFGIPKEYFEELLNNVDSKSVKVIKKGEK